VRPKPAPEKAVKKQIPRRNLKDIGTPSIKDALAGKFEKDELSAKKQHEIFTKEEEAENFTQEQFILKWNQFVSTLDDRPNLQSTLSRHPEFTPGYQFVLEIENTVQEDLINQVKTDLVSWLRRELKNSNIQVSTCITEKVKGRIIYTDAEKYDELLKKNPSLALLRQKFNLDFGQ
jgi:hypothetical protein